MLQTGEEHELWGATPSHKGWIVEYIFWGALSLVLVGLPFVLWRYLKVRTTGYQLTSQRLKISTGILNRRYEQLELLRIRDARYDQPLLLRLFGLGNVTVMTNDFSTPIVVLEAIEHGPEVVERIRNAAGAIRGRHVRMYEGV